jgi:hypothetical protein
MTKANLKTGLIYEIKSYRYAVANRTMAEIEILIFDNGDIGNQAKITKTGQGISTRKIYSDLQTALDDIVTLIEETIKNDEWVVKSVLYAINRS